MPYARRIFFLGSWELLFFLFLHPYIAAYVPLYCYLMSLGWNISCQSSLDQTEKDKFYIVVLEDLFVPACRSLAAEKLRYL